MFMDAKLTFNSAFGTPQTVTTTADSSGIIDITGAGVGVAPAMIGGYPSLNTAIGADIGLGDGEAFPWVYLTVTTAGGANSNTLTVSLKSAPDSGTYTEGTYTTCGSTGAILDSALAVGTVIMFPVPPRAPGAPLPRFYKLTYTASATLTPLAVLASIVINPPSSLTGVKYPENFVVAHA